MTAQGYFDENGRWLQKSQLVGLDADGQPLEIKPSTLGVAQTLSAVDPAEMLRHTTAAVYQLDAATVDGALATRLEAGDVFKFGFNYGADYHLETAFLVKNAEGYFCLVGSPRADQYTCANATSKHPEEYYCPSGSAEPTLVPLNYYSTPDVNKPFEL
jgi:hypothetical protein